ncbi:MAG TPA: hypothetical protein VIT22_07460 [Pseudoxanthomonas sp.]
MAQALPGNWVMADSGTDSSMPYQGPIPSRGAGLNGMISYGQAGLYRAGLLIGYAQRGALVEREQNLSYRDGPRKFAAIAQLRNHDALLAGAMKRVPYHDCVASGASALGCSQSFLGKGLSSYGVEEIPDILLGEITSMTLGPDSVPYVSAALGVVSLLRGRPRGNARDIGLGGGDTTLVAERGKLAKLSDNEEGLWAQVAPEFFDGSGFKARHSRPGTELLRDEREIGAAYAKAGNGMERPEGRYLVAHGGALAHTGLNGRIYLPTFVVPEDTYLQFAVPLGTEIDLKLVEWMLRGLKTHSSVPRPGVPRPGYGPGMVVPDLILSPYSVDKEMLRRLKQHGGETVNRQMPLSGWIEPGMGYCLIMTCRPVPGFNSWNASPADAGVYPPSFTTDTGIDGSL